MKKIYIACPAQVKTGGPELLHQLCYKLNKFGYDASMYYYGKEIDDPINEAYKFYNNKYVTALNDDSNNIIIVPETNINLLKKFNKCNKVIWWLSVDNYFNERKNIRYKIRYIFGLLEYKFRKKNIIHLAQSKYAINFLNNIKIENENIYYLSDYLNKTFLESCVDETEFKKNNNILYNPKKGFEFTKKLINKNKMLNWIPLQNLTAIEMCKLMKESKVYIDFGNHPGKDRIPREAAISGVCVITGKKGSAKFYDDVSIADEFKFEDKEENIDFILDKIEFILKNYESEYKKFEIYRQKIKEEEDKFEKDIKYVFSRIVRD